MSKKKVKGPIKVADEATIPVPSAADMLGHTGEEATIEDFNAEANELDLIVEERDQAEKDKAIMVEADGTPSDLDEEIEPTLSDIPEAPPASSYKSLAHAQLNEACEVLFQAMQPFVVTGVRSTAALLGCEVWQLVGGLVVHLHQSGGLTTPVIDPSWRSDNPVVEEERTCEYCDSNFVPNFRGERFCCNGCGEAFEMERKANVRTTRTADAGVAAV